MQRVIVFQWNPSAGFLNLIYTTVAGRVSNCFHFVVTWNFSKAFSLTSDAAYTAIKPLSRWSASSPAAFYMARQTHDAHQNTPHYAVLIREWRKSTKKSSLLLPRRCKFITGFCNIGEFSQEILRALFRRWNAGGGEDIRVIEIK